MKTFPLKVTPELHLTIKIEAAKRDMTLGDWILEAISEKLKKVGE
jgi:predicted HicB family RNase H-like nuclease